MTSLALTMICLTGNLPLAAEITDMERLLVQAGGEANREALQAKKELIARYRTADEPGRDAFATRLRTELTSPVRSVRIAAAQCLATRPTLDDIRLLLQILPVEVDASVQAALARSTAMAVSRLPRDAKGIVTTESVVLFEQMIRSDKTSPDTRGVLAELLGTFGPDALTQLRAFKADKRWAPILHSNLPASLAATGDPTAFADIKELYETDSSEGFRVACVYAMGVLARRTAVPEAKGMSSALEFLRSIALGNTNPAVSAAACEAYARWSGAVDDQELFETICAGLRVSSADPQKNYLRALFALKRPLDEQTTVLVWEVSKSLTVPAGHRKLATAILSQADTNGIE